MARSQTIVELWASNGINGILMHTARATYTEVNMLLKHKQKTHLPLPLHSGHENSSLFITILLQ